LYILPLDLCSSVYFGNNSIHVFILFLIWLKSKQVFLFATLFRNWRKIVSCHSTWHTRINVRN